MNHSPSGSDTMALTHVEFDARWHEAALSRRSRRRFDGQPGDSEKLDSLDAVCGHFRPYRDARVVLVREPGDRIFHGIIGSYGKVSGAPHVLLFIADERSALAHAHLGYVGEAAILEATRLGLDTCWVGGFFHPRRVKALTALTPGERVVAVSPVGHASAELGAAERSLRNIAGSHDRKPLETIAPGLSDGSDDRWPAWARTAAESVRIAPSAMNRQPWRLRMQEGALVVARDSHREAPRVTRALDCGIAMLHAELGALHAGVRGQWTDSPDGLDVASFRPVTDAPATPDEHGARESRILRP